MVSRSLLELPGMKPALAALTLVLGACADGGAIPAARFAGGPEGAGRVYKLNSGDKLKVTVFGEDNLSGPAEVSAAGQIALPLIGDVPAKGQTASEVRDAITRRYAEGFLKNPKVTVEVTNYRPVYVHGEVRSGGEFQYKSGLTMRDAIAMAGGYTYRANEGYVLIAREGEGEARLAMPSDVPVLPGDNIRIPERFF